MLSAFLTDETCAANCWYAREPVCHCSCGGTNHGILRVEGAEQPTRTKRMKSKLYKLHGVVPGYGAARKYVREELGSSPVTQSWDKVGEYNVQSAPKNSFSWPELKGFEPNRSFQQHPHLIWLRTV